MNVKMFKTKTHKYNYVYAVCAVGFLVEFAKK